MTGRDRQIRICKLLVFLNLCFIWGNSLLPAEASQTFSDWVKSLLELLFSSSGEDTSGSGLVRKMAHFAEFAALGFLLSLLLQLLRKRVWYALPLGMLAAIIDETIQIFVPGRGPGLADVGIDSCGVLTGILLLCFGHFLIERTQTKQFGGQ